MSQAKSSLLTLKINGQKHDVAAPMHHTLCEVLRYKLNLTGTKNKVATKATAGACTVLIDGAPVLSCLTVSAIGLRRSKIVRREITTIEGLATASGLIRFKTPSTDVALQCGFCQPE